MSNSNHAIVIKYGGSLLEDEQHRVAFLKKVAALSKKEKVILVHGGGKEITKALESAGLPTKFVNGRRYTDSATMRIVEKVLSDINAQLVSLLRKENADAEGFSGKTGNVMVGKAIQELGWVGQPDYVNQSHLLRMIETVQLPVFYSVAADAQGHSLNMNADDFALAIAVAGQAKRLVYLTDTGAILDGDKQPLGMLSPQDVKELIHNKVITGGMIVKAQACVEALRQGVGRVDICKGIQFLLDSKIPLEGTSFVMDPDRLN